MKRIIQGIFISIALIVGLQAQSDIEAIASGNNKMDWAYYFKKDDSGKARWFITSTNNSKARDVYSLMPIKNGKPGWGRVGKSVATVDTQNNSVTIGDIADNPSFEYYDAGWGEKTSNPKIQDDIELIRNSEVDVRWYFFKASNGLWYIINKNGSIFKFSKTTDGVDYDWREVDTSSVEFEFYTDEDGVKKMRIKKTPELSTRVDMTNAFITTWKTDNDGVTEDNQIKIGTNPDYKGQYNYSIDWGDGVVDNNVTGDKVHTYSNVGTYTVKIIGEFPSFYMGTEYIYDSRKLLTVEQWGDNVWQSMRRTFVKCKNLTIPAKDIPNLLNVTDMRYMFYEAESFNQSLEYWNFSNITNMDSMFYGAKSFNQPLNNWNISKVTDMSYMFDKSNLSTKNYDKILNSWSQLSLQQNVQFGAKDIKYTQSAQRARDILTNTYGWNITDGGVDITTQVATVKKLETTKLKNGNYQFRVTLSKALQDSQDIYLNFDNLQNGWFKESDDGGHSKMECNGTECKLQTSIKVAGERQVRAGIFKDGSLDIVGNYSEIKGFSVVEDENTTIIDPRPIANSKAFITTWKTTTANETITIPTAGSGYNYSIDWGDGSVDRNITGDKSHSYSIAGVYTVSIIGKFPRIYSSKAKDSVKKLMSIEQWGDIKWKSMHAAFASCPNLIYNATDTPNLSDVTDLSLMFYKATSFNGDIGNWDVSNVTNMKLFLGYAKSFNQDISAWNVSNVTNMGDMFYSTETFNQPLNNWDVSSVTNINGMFNNSILFNQPLNNWDTTKIIDMHGVFLGATSFNQPLNNWNVSNVTNMSSLFDRANLFNQPLNNWDTSKVMTMEHMFYKASSFNQPLNNWNTSKITNIGSIFHSASSFNQPLNNWDISNVTNMIATFSDAKSFNQPLDKWNVSNVTNMRFMFAGAKSFNQSLNSWDVSKVIEMSGMFQEATLFNQPLNSWNVSNVTKIYNMFYLATKFNQPLDNWDISKVTIAYSMFFRAENFNQPLNNWDVSNVVDMGYMFQEATSFNQPLNSWNVSKVTRMRNMFNRVTSFNQDISSWNISKVTDMRYMFNSSGLSTQNYDKILNSWSQLPPQQDVKFGASGIKYSQLAQRARDILTNTYGWDITDGGVDATTQVATVNKLETTKLENGNYQFRVTLSKALQNSQDIYLNFDNSSDGWVDESSDGGLYAMDCNGPECMLEIPVEEVGERKVRAGIFAENSTQIIGGYSDTTTFEVEEKAIVRKDFSRAFVTTWKTTTANETITIPTNGSGYNYTIDWGDGSVDREVIGDKTHSYDTAGVYTVKIIGEFPHIYNYKLQSKDNSKKLISVEQWGDIKWKSMLGSFYKCSNLSINAKDNPNLSSVKSMSNMFYKSTKFNQNINNWDVSNVTDMRSMFAEAISFNQTLNNWNVSNITDMGNMFYKATKFNQNINNWDVSNVTDMYCMFINAQSFNQPLNSWDVSNVTDMGSIFAAAISFNQNINDWDVSNVITIERMFSNAKSFNQPLNNWDVSNITNMGATFSDAKSFNQPLDKWNVSNVTDMNSMFSAAISFNQPLNSWDVSNVINANRIFQNAKVFNQDISNWNISNVKYMNYMFDSSGLLTKNYDKILNSWSQVPPQQDVKFGASGIKYSQLAQRARDILTNNYGWDITDGGLEESQEEEEAVVREDFSRAFVTTWKTTQANEEIIIPTNGGGYNYTIDWGDGSVDREVTGDKTHKYDTAGVYTVKIIGEFPQIASYLFKENAKKLISIEQWGDNKWRSTHGLFMYCSNLVGNATDIPDLSNVKDMSYMFSKAKLFNQNINSWNVSNVTNMMGMFIEATSFNQPLDSWDVSNVTNISQMFAHTDKFNQPLNSWDVSNVTQMQEMFAFSDNFNQPLNSWETSNVVNMSWMFMSTKKFNQPLDNWDVSSVTNMNSIFSQAEAFNQPLNNWDISSVTNMNAMFKKAINFNQALNSWNVSNVIKMISIFSNSNLSTQNYSDILMSWSSLELQQNVVFGAEGIKYNLMSRRAKDSIVRSFNWTITDGGVIEESSKDGGGSSKSDDSSKSEGGSKSDGEFAKGE